jgi:hypothetical protein
MPVSNEAIADVFKYLGGLGYRRPDGWKPDPKNPSKAEIFSSWRHVFRNVTDADLSAAAVVYVEAGNTWWPNAGQLIALIPPSGPPLLGWARIWDRVMAGAHDRRRGRNKPPGDGWHLADRPDERAAAMIALVAAGGWEGICNTGDREHSFAAKKFERAFVVQLETATASRRWIAAGGTAPRQLTMSEGATS